MIVVRLMGGLGNQLFQYAVGRALALRLGTELKLDTGFFTQQLPDTPPRQYALGSLSIRAAQVSEPELSHFRLSSGRVDRLLSKGRQRLGLPQRKYDLYRERSFRFDANVAVLPDNSYLIGYWQSERYFYDCRQQLLQELVCTLPLDDGNRQLLEKIRATMSVAVHVRRGDYVNSPQANAVHGLCSLDYYRQAVELVAHRLGSPHFFLFSDDPDWVADHLELPYPATLVTINQQADPVLDLHLISACRHAIIANSSFSWWGGWLNQQPDKLVIAPARWFADPCIDTADLLPQGWIRL